MSTQDAWAPDSLQGIVKLTGALVFRDGQFVNDDLWFDTGVPVEPSSVPSTPTTSVAAAAPAAVPQSMDVEITRAQIIDPMGRFWQAQRSKDYASHLTFDLSGYYLVPGYIDIQLNGAFGVDYSTLPLPASADQDSVSGAYTAAVLPPAPAMSEFTVDSLSKAVKDEEEQLLAGTSSDTPATATPTTAPAALADRGSAMAIAAPTAATVPGSASAPTTAAIPASDASSEGSSSAPGAASTACALSVAPPLSTLAQAAPDESVAARPATLRPIFVDSDLATPAAAAARARAWLQLARQWPEPAAAPGERRIPGVGGEGGAPECLKQMIVDDPDLAAVARKLPRFGVTAYLPTVISSHPNVYRAAGERFGQHFAAFAAAMEGGVRTAQAEPLGLHLEGPFIAVPGAHDPETLRAAGTMPLRALQHVYGGSLLRLSRLVTLAPELRGALGLVRALRERGVTVSMGHSHTDYTTATKAVEQGAGLVTHMFNAMTAFHHRDPGLIGLLGQDSQVPYSIIADGIHAHPASVRIAHGANPEHTVLISDAMCAMGLGPGTYKLGEMTVVTDSHHRATIAGTDTLAGAITALDRCVANLRAFAGCSDAEAVSAATEAPARVVGVYPRKGSLRVGADADVVVLDPKDLSVVATIVAGQLAFCRTPEFPPLARE